MKRFNLPPIIAFAGRAGAGKDTAAEAVREISAAPVVQMGFADPIRAGLTAMLGIPEYVMQDRSLKEMPCPPYDAITVRKMMQTLGFEWGRCMVDADVWVKAAQIKYAKLRCGFPPVVVFTDCRFPNEAEWVLSEGGIVIEIVRPYGPMVGPHPSEAGLPPGLVECRITNSGTVSDLKADVRFALRFGADALA